MTARYLVADVFDGLATLEDGSVDLVVTSPPFLALRSYLPADHPDKHREIGSESTPAEFIDVMLRVTQELRRVLAPHGSICIELGDTYAGSGGAGGDYDPEGLRAGQPKFRQQPPNTAHRLHDDGSIKTDSATRVTEAKNRGHLTPLPAGTGWPLAKSRTLIPQLYEIALAYGINPLTGTPSPAGQWRIRNVVTWARPNPPVGALGDKWRPATSDLIVACVSGKRYWDDLATRKAYTEPVKTMRVGEASASKGISGGDNGNPDKLRVNQSPSGAPLLDYWEIPPGGYKGSHYAVFPDELVVPCVKAMCPQFVCRSCGEPSRRIVERREPIGVTSHVVGEGRNVGSIGSRLPSAPHHDPMPVTTGWSDCGCSGGHCNGEYACDEHYRPGLVLDPFAGSGTTLAVATGHGHDAIGIDLDSRNAELARERIGPFFFEEIQQ